MSVKGLLETEKKANSLQKSLEKSFNKQLRELRQEIKKVQYLLGDRKAAASWANSSVEASRVQTLISLMNDTERLYLTAGDSGAARIFKQRTERQLRGRLTNLKANELEVKMRVEAARATSQRAILSRLTEVKREGAIRELYTQSRGAGGFISGTGRGYMQDLVTLETKAAGSKTLGEYMENLYTTYESGLKDVFVKGIVRGDSYEQMENNLINATNITKGKARLLVRTESNAIFNESVRDVIDNNPLVKGYRFRAVLDSRTSKTCQKHDGKYIPKEDVEPGINFPPLHPNCRSTVTTVLVNENEREDIVQRYTKNNRNEWVKVPPGMTYPDFKARMQEFRDTPTPRLGGVKYSSTLTRERTIRQDDYRIVVVNNTRIVPNVPSSAAILDNRLSPSVAPEAQIVYDNALKNEAKITNRMINLVDKRGASLYGVEFSAKTGTSVSEKIERKKAKILPGLPVPKDDEIVASMTDLVRYTIVTDHADMTNAAEGFLDDFKKSGFNVVKLDNKYIDGETPYKAIHLDVKSKDGQMFEVQFQSKQSLEVKHASDILYSEQRKVTTSKERKLELDKQMVDLWNTLPRPKNVDKLKSFAKEVK